MEVFLFSVHYKDDEIDKALKAGRDGNIAKIWYDRWHALVMGDAVHWMASYDDGALGNKVKALASEYGKPPVNAEPSFHGDGSVTFSGSRPYLKFDEKALLADAGRILSNGTSGEADVSVLDEKKPDLTEKEAKEVNVVLGRYTTEFGIDGSRDKNIEIAAKSIKGVYVKPGESFSYNQATGARSKKRLSGSAGHHQWQA